MCRVFVLRYVIRVRYEIQNAFFYPHGAPFPCFPRKSFAFCRTPCTPPCTLFISLTARARPARTLYTTSTRYYYDTMYEL